MTYRGIVQGGVILFQDTSCLPDGTEVSIVPIVSTPDADGETKTIGQKLAELGRWAETQPCELPSDLATNHDYYLHGLPKRK